MSSPPLTLNKLADIDHFFVRANTVSDEARKHREAFNYDLAVRRSQEAFELYLKSILLFLQKEYPAIHGPVPISVEKGMAYSPESH